MHERKRSAAAALGIVLGLWVADAAGQQPEEKLSPSIQARGEAVLTAQPDQARINVGVVTQAATSSSAVADNAKTLEATLARLRALLGAGADIKTVSYTVTPNYRYPREGGEPTITGYTATNVVRITLNDLTKVGPVIDTAAQTGANRIQSLQFTLKDEESVQTDALRAAAQSARRKIDALAAALGVRPGRVLSALESGPVVVPVRDVAFARSEAATTPIEPGTIEVRASVTLTMEILR
jgi:uncharacterized protein YggE